MDDPLLHIVHIADIHFWRIIWNPLCLLNKRFLGNLNVMLRRHREFAVHRAENYARVITQTGAKFALFTGDFTSTSLDEEFAQAREFVEQIQQQGLNVAVLPGNHDVYTFESRRHRRFENYFQGIAPESGYPTNLALANRFRLLLIPTAQPNILSARGQVPDEVLQWIQQEIKTLDTEPVLVAAHYPILYETRAYHSAPSHRLAGAEKMRDILGKSGKQILYMCGHVHRFSLTQDPQYGNITHLSTGALFRMDSRQNTCGEFSEILVSDRSFVVRRNVCKPGNLWISEEFSSKTSSVFAP